MPVLSRIANPQVNRLVRWFGDPEKSFHRWLGFHSLFVSLLGLVLAALNPPHGTGITVCWMKALTGVPCLGCGLTRSLSCALHGLWLESWQYHPFGVPLLMLFAVTILVGLSPRSWQGRLERFANRHALGLNLFYLTSVVLFISHGLIRSLMSLLTNA